MQQKKCRSTLAYGFARDQRIESKALAGIRHHEQALHEDQNTYSHGHSSGWR